MAVIGGLAHVLGRLNLGNRSLVCLHWSGVPELQILYVHRHALSLWAFEVERHVRAEVISLGMALLAVTLAHVVLTDFKE